MLVAWDVKKVAFEGLVRCSVSKVLKHKCEEPEFESQQWHKIPGMVMCAYGPSTEEAKLAWLELAGRTT